MAAILNGIEKCRDDLKCLTFASLAFLTDDLGLYNVMPAHTLAPLHS